MNVVPFLVPPRYPHPLVAGTDVWRDDIHGGSDNLGEFPPSWVEKYWSDWATLGDEVAAVRLREVAGSELRCVALCGDAIRRREAERLLGRIS